MSARRARTRSRDRPLPPTGPIPVDHGTASFDAVPGTVDEYVLTVNGVPSSPYHATDPGALDFDYLRWIAAAVDVTQTGGASVRAVHIGGAACALARYLDHDRPGSRQTVVEIDAALADWVRTHLDLPRAPGLAIRAADGAVEIARFRPQSIDVVIRDAFAGDTTPAALTTPEWFDSARSALKPTGAYIANVADDPQRTALRAEVDGLRARFSRVAALVDPTRFRRRRRGNVVVLATDADLDLDALSRTARAVDCEVRTGARLLSHLGPSDPRR